MTAPADIINALAQYFPQTPGQEKLINDIKRFSGGSPDPLIEFIKSGPETCHYGTMLFLRHVYGVAIWGVDSDDGTTMWYKYKITATSDWALIKPQNSRDYKKEAAAFGYTLDQWKPPKK